MGKHEIESRQGLVPRRLADKLGAWERTILGTGSGAQEKRGDSEVKSIAILGSTGSIGTQTLDVIRRHPDRFRVTALACGHNVELLREQIREFKPKLAVCDRPEDASELAWEFPGVSFAFGEEGLGEVATAGADMVVSALSGIRGLLPTYQAILSGSDIAFANKETLVTGGRLVMDAVRESGVRMLPVDSEHSAIFQCLEGNRDRQVRRILLTASGGPFRGASLSDLEKVTPEMALAHPNWSMGRKVTIDSATMMNKGLEMIEARWLFDIDLDRIQVLVHPQSVVHSAVEFMDTSVIAQMASPDMRVPISLALSWPERLDAGDLAPELALDFFGDKARALTFEPADTSVFRCLKIAADAGRAGGNEPVIMNAANEVLVQAFLDRRIGFTEIPDRIEEALEAHGHAEVSDVEEILDIDQRTRAEVESRLP